MTTRTTFALDRLVCGVKTLIVVGALETVTGVEPAVLLVPVSIISYCSSPPVLVYVLLTVVKSVAGCTFAPCPQLRSKLVVTN